MSASNRFLKASPSDDDDHHHKEGPDLSIYFASGTTTIDDSKGSTALGPELRQEARAAVVLYNKPCRDAGGQSPGT